MEAAAMDWISAVTFAHPANVTERHVLDAKRELSNLSTLNRRPQF
jgi:hypothetical protein